MYGGDGNADGLVSEADRTEVWAPQAGAAGYLSGDFNMDAQAGNKDKNDTWLENDGLDSKVPQ